jgi:hypothetical protein
MSQLDGVSPHHKKQKLKEARCFFESHCSLEMISWSLALPAHYIAMCETGSLQSL